MNIHRAIARALTAAFVIAWSGAQAVSLNPRGLGEVLIYPYYTVNKNQDTLLTVGNASDLGKLVNVNIREGMNGRPIFSFRLYLSPHDIWTARISQVGGDEGGAALFTGDSSCTYAEVVLSPEGSPFDASAYAGGSVLDPDGGPTGLARTREGTIELIEVGTIIPGSPLDAATTHAQTGEPNAGRPSCDRDVIGNVAGVYADRPIGGLYGSVAIVNVGEGTFFGYEADALADFSDVALVNTMALSWDLLLVANSVDSATGGAIAHLLDAAGKPLALDYAYGLDAVNAVLMADTLVNEYLIVPELGANTDWIVTFPTRMFHVDNNYVAGEARPPFAHPAVQARSDASVYPHVWDQEEGHAPCEDCGISPPPPASPTVLPWHVNALSFRTGAAAEAPSGVLGSRLATNVEPWGTSGWMQLNLADGDGGHEMIPDAGGTILHGLPATGFMVYNIINSNAAPGRLANYGGAFAHRASVAHSQVPAGVSE